MREADEFYADIHSGVADEDARRVQRQALAGMLWNRQCYHYNIFDWLQGDPGQPPPPAQRKSGRNHDWQHLNSDEVLSMPDKWEYPWFAAWDLGFHCIALSLADPESPSGNWYCSGANGTCIPMVSIQRTNGTSAM